VPFDPTDPTLRPFRLGLLFTLYSNTIYRITFFCFLVNRKIACMFGTDDLSLKVCICVIIIIIIIIIITTTIFIVLYE